MTVRRPRRFSNIESIAKNNQLNDQIALSAEIEGEDVNRLRPLTPIGAQAESKPVAVFFCGDKKTSAAIDGVSVGSRSGVKWLAFLHLVDTFAGIAVGVARKWIASPVSFRITGKLRNDRRCRSVTSDPRRHRALIIARPAGCTAISLGAA